MTTVATITPLITETTIDLTKNNWYSFRTSKDFNKNQIRRLIEELFKVNVLEIKTLLVKEGNKRSLRNRKLRLGETWKKVMVKIKPEQKIAIFDVANN